MYKEVFASRIKVARERTGFTQNEICKALNMAQPTLANYELGRREPDFETLGKMAEYYGVSIDWLFGLAMQKGGKPNYVTGDIETVGNIGDGATVYIEPKRRRKQNDG